MAREGVVTQPAPRPMTNACESRTCQYWVAKLRSRKPAGTMMAPTRARVLKYPASKRGPETMLIQGRTKDWIDPTQAIALGVELFRRLVS